LQEKNKILLYKSDKQSLKNSFEGHVLAEDLKGKSENCRRYMWMAGDIQATTRLRCANQ
jgi:hypothetical protein